MWDSKKESELGLLLDCKSNKKPSSKMVMLIILRSLIVSTQFYH